MWIYWRRHDDDKWCVGYYATDGSSATSTFTEEYEAMKRVHYLNGGD